MKNHCGLEKDFFFFFSLVPDWRKLNLLSFYYYLCLSIYLLCYLRRTSLKCEILKCHLQPQLVILCQDSKVPKKYFAREEKIK